MKLCVKKRKLTEQVQRYEKEYLEQTIAAENQRRTTDGALRKSVERLEIVEKQRLAHCQTALGRFQRKIAQLGPNIHLMFERHMNTLNGAVNADPLVHIASLTPTVSANHRVVLCDFHAENFGEVISVERRRDALERASSMIDDELPQINGSPHSPNDYSQNPSDFSMAEFIEYLSFKIKEAIRTIDGTQNRIPNRLAVYQQKTKDKFGLPETVLNIPLVTIPTSQIPKQPNSPSALQCVPTSSSTDDCDYEPIYAYDTRVDAASRERRSGEKMELSSCGTRSHETTTNSAATTPDSNGYLPVASNSTGVTQNNSSHSNNNCSNSNQSSSPHRESFDEDSGMKQIRRVLYDFMSNSEDELSVRAGDCVIVERQLNKDWLLGYVISDLTKSSSVSKIGRFPASYVA
ncbi:hypothetical protein AB6A40_002376 [Gnathostoma spinigerum]|uniref:SH3 domain-containing protein n=1 Tax=Gnathostoma spinigerum TaxID=75299 RepID=A0ABD6EGI9_9BILA